MKQVGTTHWVGNNNRATNSSGFTALPGGYHDSGTYVARGRQVAGGVQLRTAEPAPGSCL
jgi:hypothetical protein